jgi:TetR/AcrR family transcriptional repressor of nem operon
MRYPKEHKAAMRERIVVAAGRLLRRHGYDGVGIDDIMDAAELTRGGFYGYFRSKAHLFAEVMGDEHGFVRLLRRRRSRDRSGLRAEATAIIADYLAPAHRETVGRGCHLTALSVDAARASPAVRRAYATQVRALVAELARGLDRPAELDPRALAALAACVGGLVIARAANDEPLARAMLRASRAAAVAQLERKRSSSNAMAAARARSGSSRTTTASIAAT